MDDYPGNWMWSEACALLARAERLGHNLFEPRPGRSAPVWEPPVDILELPDEVLVYVALPGVEVESLEAVIENGALLLSGERRLPPAMRSAVIHRLELPQGRFLRRIMLPALRYDAVRRSVTNGCVIVSLRKAEVRHG